MEGGCKERKKGSVRGGEGKKKRMRDRETERGVRE
jgi:hypothetical protein